MILTATDRPSMVDRMTRLGITGRQRHYWIEAGILRPIDTGHASRTYRYDWTVLDLHDAVVAGRLAELVWAGGAVTFPEADELADLMDRWRAEGRPTDRWIGWADRAPVILSLHELARTVRDGAAVVAASTRRPTEEPT